MHLEISPIGNVIVAVYSALVLAVVVWPLWRLLRRWRWKWALILPLVLPLLAAPWAEEAWIAWHFEQACKEAGVHVYRRVEVQGFYDATGSGFSTPGPLTYQPAIESLNKQGFRFYEKLVGYDPRATPLQVSHVEKINGQWQVSILDRPTARYHYKHAYQPTPYKIEEPVGWKLEKVETLVVDSQTGEVIGRNTLYKRRPSIVEGLWIGLIGSGLVMCPSPDVKPYIQPLPFPEAVLKPISDN